MSSKEFISKLAAIAPKPSKSNVTDNVITKEDATMNNTTFNATTNNTTNAKENTTMNKILLVALALLVLTMSVAAAEGEIKIGQVQYAAHGTKCFAVMTVVLQGDVIVAALIDEYQVGAGMVGVPNSENGFGGFTDGKVLYSKRVNAEAYSTNMAKSGSTVALDVNYDLIQDFCVGKTVSELELAIVGFGGDATKAVDAVSGATLVDTLGYLQGLLAAAKAAQ